MNKEEFLIGFYKTSKESLFLKINELEYLDLIKKKIVNKEEIDISSLTLFNKYSLKRKDVITEYKKSREELINTNNYYYGKYVLANNIKYKKNKINSNIVDINWERKYLDEGLYLSYNKLYSYCYDVNGKMYWSCLEKTNNDCNLPFFENNYKYVVLQDITLKEIINESVLNRKRLNECNYLIKKKY